jgi:hypothetical protein
MGDPEGVLNCVGPRHRRHGHHCGMSSQVQVLDRRARDRRGAARNGETPARAGGHHDWGRLQGRVEREQVGLPAGRCEGEWAGLPAGCGVAARAGRLSGQAWGPSAGLGDRRQGDRSSMLLRVAAHGLVRRVWCEATGSIRRLPAVRCRLWGAVWDCAVDR